MSVQLSESDSTSVRKNLAILGVRGVRNVTQESLAQRGDLIPPPSAHVKNGWHTGMCL